MESGARKVILFFIVAILTGIFADASVSLTPDWQRIAGTTLPDIVFTDADQHPVHLSDYKGKILLLHPMFAHCPGACSIVAAKIAQAYNGLPDSQKQKIRVLSFSFDPDETDDGLIHFQKITQWKVVRTSSNQIEKILDALDFKTLQLAQSNYEHSNLVFVLNGDRVLRDYVFGSDLTSARLMRSIEIAEGSENISRSGLLIFAAIGFLISTFLFVTLWMKKKSPNVQQGMPNRRS